MKHKLIEPEWHSDPQKARTLTHQRADRLNNPPKISRSYSIVRILPHDHFISREAAKRLMSNLVTAREQEKRSRGTKETIGGDFSECTGSRDAFKSLCRFVLRPPPHRIDIEG